MSFTVKDYQAAHPQGIEYINKCLQDIDAHLVDLGCDWFNVPLHTWPQVFQKIGLLSDNLVQRYQIAIKAFYRWAQENGGVPYSQVSHSNFIPKLGENLKAGLQGRYVPSLDRLFELSQNVQEHYVRKGIFAAHADDLILSMLWMQMTAEEIINLRAENVVFYTKDNERLLNKNFDFSQVHHAFIECVTERRISVSHKTVLSLLFYVYKRAGDLLFTTENGGVYKISSFTKRLSRIFTQLNEENGTNLSAKSVRSSGLYYRLYRNWEEMKMPYVYTEDTSAYLLSLLNLPPKTSVAVKQAEFARFLEYIREIQGKNI